MIKPELLINLEQKFGGFVGGVANGRKATGGDRMGGPGRRHRYAQHYSDHLPMDPKVVIELGVFKGTGLAIWCDLYPRACVIGLDIDLSNFQENKQRLIELGAFRHNQPQIYQFNKYKDDLGTILNGQSVDVLIDDSCHKTEGIVLFLKNNIHHVSDTGVIFVEDNTKVHKRLIGTFPDYQIHPNHNMTIMMK